MAKIRKIYDQTIKPDGSKTTIYPITSTRAVFGADGRRLDDILAGLPVELPYIALDNVAELPLEENHNGYLIGENLYVWVGTGGDTLDGVYQNCGNFKGAKGDKGDKGDPGNQIAPDGEDLISVETEEGEILKFSDRSNLNGKGYCILRKEKSFGEQVTEENTIYEVRYDFDLNDNSVSIPSGCSLFFNGGKILNGTLVGDHTTFNTDVTYQIFDNVEFSGFDIPFMDVRWLGAVSDFNESTQTGTDNATFFSEAIELCGKYYAGMGIRIVGRYYLATAITTTYDVNIFGYHNNSRRLLVNQPNPSSPSLIFIGANMNAITMNGLGASTKSANISLHNLKIWGASTSTFINYTCSGAPGRVSVIEECEFRGAIALKLTNSGADTMLGNLTVSKCNVWYTSKFIVATSTSNNRTFCNLVIENCNIEQGGDRQIDIQNAFSSVIIKNNIIENVGEPIWLSNALKARVRIEDNYFELITGDACAYVNSGNAGTDVWFKNNFCDSKIKLSITLCRVHELDFDSIADGSAFRYCKLKKSCYHWAAFKLSWIQVYCLFDYLSIFSGGFELPENKTVSKTIGNALATTCSTSYSSFVTKDYAEMPENADFFVFATDGTTLTAMLARNGSGVANIIYTTPDCFCVYTALPYATGENALQIMGSSECAVGPVQILTPDKSLLDVRIPTTDSQIAVSSSTRPTFTKPKGYTIFDTTLGKMIVWNGTAWVNVDGTSLA